MEAVEHDLAFAGRLVGQLDLGEADWVLGPVAAVVGRVGVNVDRVVRGGFCFSTCKEKFKFKKIFKSVKIRSYFFLSFIEI